MQQIEKVVTITARVHPHVCGIGDYSVNLVSHCKTQLGIKATIIVEKGCQASSEPITILPYVETWSKSGWKKLLNFLETHKVETIILQYAPWLYSSKGFDPHLIKFWKECAKKFQLLLIVHETYFWFLKHPGTWIIGLLQQYVLRKLVHSSHQVFSGSELYLNRLKRYSNCNQKFHYLPIPSNINLKTISSEKKQELRQKLQIKSQQIVITLFGCASSIWQPWIAALDACLIQHNYPVVWLLLGSSQSLSLSLQNLVVRPGYLSPNELSYYLQISNLMLMPHEYGISAKRTSLMSALEHGLPVVGTEGMLTDSFLRQLPSVILAADGHYLDFEKQVLDTLSNLSNLHKLAQKTQAYYHNYLSWSVVNQKLLPYLQNHEQC